MLSTASSRLLVTMTHRGCCSNCRKRNCRNPRDTWLTRRHAERSESAPPSNAHHCCSSCHTCRSKLARASCSAFMVAVRASDCIATLSSLSSIRATASGMEEPIAARTHVRFNSASMFSTPPRKYREFSGLARHCSHRLKSPRKAEATKFLHEAPTESQRLNVKTEKRKTDNNTLDTSSVRSSASSQSLGNGQDLGVGVPAELKALQLGTCGCINAHPRP